VQFKLGPKPATAEVGFRGRAVAIENLYDRWLELLCRGPEKAMWNSASGTVEVAPNERKHPLSSVRLRACNMRGAGNPGLRTGINC
jgi:hypothetical protein